jgi:hypothetical protein
MPKQKKMKAQLVEGSEATANFEQLASAVLQAGPKKQTTKSSSQKKPKKSDKS